MVTPNPTGSTGYGQSFTDAIKESWGGLPYQDLVSGFEYIKEVMDYVDTDRAVALGASYGGYMMNWMQGHSLGKEFKGMLNRRACVFAKFIALRMLTIIVNSTRLPRWRLQHNKPISLGRTVFPQSRSWWAVFY